jgi:hypothetical protein
MYESLLYTKDGGSKLIKKTGVIYCYDWSVGFLSVAQEEKVKGSYL